MKILLTGLPKRGKTTLLSEIVEGVNLKLGLLAREEVSGEQRTGFSLVDQLGATATLAHTDSPTDYPVGRYYVDLESLDNFIDHLTDFTSHQLLFIDEIGQMQLYSKKFIELVDSYIASENDFIGTVSAVYEHPFIEEVKSRSDILLCEVTSENHHVLRVALAAAINHRRLFNKLPLSQQSTVLDLARHYIAQNQYVSLKKLFYNALRYISEHKVETQDSTYLVRGDHGSRTVSMSDETYTCNCDFFNARGQFVGNPGECSHIQVVKIIQS